MIYSISKNALQMAIGDGLAYQFEATEQADLDISRILLTINQHDRF
jgi:hypothetical protein